MLHLWAVFYEMFGTAAAEALVVATKFFEVGGCHQPPNGNGIPGLGASFACMAVTRIVHVAAATAAIHTNTFCQCANDPSQTIIINLS